MLSRPGLLSTFQPPVNREMVLELWARNEETAGVPPHLKGRSPCNVEDDDTRGRLLVVHTRHGGESFLASNVPELESNVLAVIPRHNLQCKVHYTVWWRETVSAWSLVDMKCEGAHRQVWHSSACQKSRLRTVESEMFYLCDAKYQRCSGSSDENR